MSKEATGSNGAILGSDEYWDKLNQSTFFGELMPSTFSTKYYETLETLGDKAGNAIETVYRDLSDHGKFLHLLPSSNRNALEKQVKALYDICEMTGRSAFHSSDCISGLSLSSMSPWRNPFLDETAVKNAVSLIKSNSYFSTNESFGLVKDAARWDVAFAARDDERKKLFLELLLQGKGNDFLQTVVDEYEKQADSRSFCGKCGYVTGSREYSEAIEREAFGKSLPPAAGASWGNFQYTVFLRGCLQTIADQLERDLDAASRANHYITDETEQKLQDAVNDLARCGIRTAFFDGKIKKLAWFVGGDSAKILQLQKALNELGFGRLTEDGVYGEKTNKAWLDFLLELEHGFVPTLCWVDNLKSETTGITIGSTKNAAKYNLKNAFQIGKHPYIHIDEPHNGGLVFYRGVKKEMNYPHINFDEVQDSNILYDWLKKQYNHYPLTDEAYNTLKDFESFGKIVKITGKVLFVTGIVLDVLKLGIAISDDLNDTDKKLGKTTVSAAISIGGSWAGASLGAEIGSLLGAFTGPAAPIAIPLLSFVGGIAGSFAGSRLAEWVVDITVVEG